MHPFPSAALFQFFVFIFLKVFLKFLVAHESPGAGSSEHSWTSLIGTYTRDSGIGPRYLRHPCRDSRIRRSVHHTIGKAALKPSWRSNPCVRGHASSCFQRKGSGSSFSFSSYIQSVTPFCCSVLTFSLCVYPLLKLVIPNPSKCVASVRATTPVKSVSPPPPQAYVGGCSSIIGATIFLVSQLLPHSSSSLASVTTKR